MATTNEGEEHEPNTEQRKEEPNIILKSINLLKKVEKDIRKANKKKNVSNKKCMENGPQFLMVRT